MIVRRDFDAPRIQSTYTFTAKPTQEETELEEENGRYLYKVELRDAQNQQWDLKLDAATGEVLENQKDD